ncbi:hypothetical protein BJ170DRAFT_496208 [Xylariales sp. AK1849]|nr:hypothetical protein BJ170DRAFT_496208 [Xylariales sp. AK1849]
MTFGQIRQLLQLRALPPGWDIFITNIQLNNAAGGWWPGVSTVNRTLSFYKTTIENERSKLPLQLNLDSGQGIIGESHFSSLNRTDSGKGPDVTVDFLLQGSGGNSGKKEYYKAAGSIWLSTSDWGWWSRPHQCYVRYGLTGAGSSTITTKVPVGTAQLNGVGFVFGWNASTKQLGLNGSNNAGALNDLAGQAASGNFPERGDAAGWSKMTITV